MVNNFIKRLPRHFLALTLVAISSIALTACGGGGSDNSTIFDPTDTPSSTNPHTDNTKWVEGQFQSSGQFVAKCASPRTGFSPLTDSRYPDQQGTLLDELNWLRSWNNNVYLWYREVKDQDPANFSNTETYFQQLKTTAITSTGKPKDPYHYAIPSPEWEQRSSEGASYGYGAKWIINHLGGGQNEVLVAFVLPNSVAAEKGLVRGSKILSADGVSLNNITSSQDSATLNNAFFPSKAGVTHQFEIQLPNRSPTIISMQSERLVEQTVLNTKTVQTANGKVGYLTFNSHLKTSESHLIQAINQLKHDNIQDLVLDLRYNGGGLLGIASQLGYMIAGEARTQNKTFENLIYNDKHPEKSPFDGTDIKPTPFLPVTVFESYGEELPTLNLPRLFVLTTDDTCSASESLMNSLEGINVDVIQIGSTTCGKPYGFRPVDNCSWTYMTVNFKGTNEKGFGDYANGFAPSNSNDNDAVKLTGCYQTDDFSQALGHRDEAMFKTALYYREHNQCPSSSAQGLQLKSLQPKGKAMLYPPIEQQWMNNKFMLNMPD